MALRLYVSRHSPSLSVTVAAGTVKFSDKTLKLDDENEEHKKLIEELDEAIRTVPAVSSMMYSEDLSEAERISRQYQKEQQERYAATRGPLTSDTINRIESADGPLPIDMRSDSGSGNAADGVSAPELQSLLNRDKPQASDGV